MTLQNFYILFKYLSKFKYGTKAFNVANANQVLNILGIEQEIEESREVQVFTNTLAIHIQDFNEQEEQAKAINEKYNKYLDPTKFDVLQNKSGRPSQLDEKFKVSFFPDVDKYGDKANYILCVITDLYTLGLNGLEKTLDLVDCNHAIIRVQKAKLDQNQKEHEARTLQKKINGN